MRISIYFLMLIFSNIFVFAQDSKSSDIKELANIINVEYLLIFI